MPISSVRDANRVPAIFGVSSVDLTTPVAIKVNPITGAMLIDSTSMYTALDARYVQSSGASGALTILGNSDTTQLIVRGNSTQTSTLVSFQNSSSVQQFSFSNTGSAVFNTAGNSVSFQVKGQGSGGTNLFVVNGASNLVAIGTSAQGGLANFDPVNGIVFNDVGNNLDTRFEGDTDQNLLFLQGSTDRVGVGTATPGHKLSVVGDIDLTANIYVNNDKTVAFGDGHGGNNQFKSGTDGTFIFDINAGNSVKIKGGDDAGTYILAYTDTSFNAVWSTDTLGRMFAKNSISSGAAGGTTGTVKLVGSTSGTASIVAPAAAGTPTLTTPVNSGTLATVVKTGIGKISGGAQQWGQPNTTYFNTGTTALVVGEDRYVPLFVAYPVTLTAWFLEVTAGPASNANIRVGVYAADTDMQPTGAPLYDSGSVSVASAFTGTKTATGLSVALTPGAYLVVINCDVIMTLRTFISGSPIIGTSLGATPMVQRVTVSRAYAAFPNPGTKWTTTNTSAGGLQNFAVWQWTE